MSDPYAAFSKPVTSYDTVSKPVAKPRPKAPAKRTLLEEVAGASANITRSVPGLDEIGAALGVGADLLSGKVRSLGDAGKSWERNRGYQQTYAQDFDTRRPNAAAFSRGTGMASTMLVPATGTAGAFANSGRMLNGARGAVLAGNQGMLTAALDQGSGKERLAAASKAAVDPLTLALGAFTGSLAPAKAKPKIAKAQAVPLEELQAQKSAAYKAVDASGARYSPEAFDGLVRDLSTDLQKANLSAMRHPKAASMLQDIQGLSGQSPSLTELDQLRQVIRRDVASVPDEAERFFGMAMIDKIDDFIDNADQAAMAAGSSEDASSLIKSARDLNSRYRKTQSITDAMEEARFQAGKNNSGGNIDNNTRQKLDVVRKKTNNFTPAELAAMEKVIIGGKGQNTLRTLGKLSPQGNGLMTALSIGGAAANPLLAIPTMGGAVSKTVADAMTRGNVDELLRIVSSGSVSGPELQAMDQALSSAPSSEAVNALRRAVAAKLTRAVGVQGGTGQVSPALQ
jgi:hypothetical protein